MSTSTCRRGRPAETSRPGSAGSASRSRRRAPTSRARWSSAGCSTWSSRAAEERQDDQLVPGRRRRAPTARRAQGIVCGAHNFAVGDLVVVVAARRRAARRLRDRRAQDLRPRLRRDDLLRPRAGHRRRPRRHPGAPRPGARATSRRGDPARRRCSACATTSSSSTINPDRGYCLSLRGIAREAALGYGAPFHDPARCATCRRRRATATRSGSTTPDGCPVFVDPHGDRLRPVARRPRGGWPRRVQLAGMRPISLAVDVTNYVMLELGQPIHGVRRRPAAGPIVVRRATRGREADHPRRRRPHAVGRGPADHRRRRPDRLAGVMGGATTEMSDATTDVVIEAAHFEPTTISRTARRHKLPYRGVQALRARGRPAAAAFAADRVAALLVEHGGGVRRRRDLRRQAAGRGRPSRLDATCPARVAGMPIDAADQVAHLRDRRLHGRRDGDGTLDGAAADLAPRPHRPLRPRRGGRPARRLRRGAVGAAAGARRAAGSPASQRLRRRVGRALAGAGFVEVLSWPFVGRRPTSTGSGCPADDLRRDACGVANPLSEEAPLLRPRRCCPACWRPLPATSAAGSATSAMFETAPVTRARAAARVGARSRRRPPPDDDELAAAAGGGAASSRCTSAWSLAGDREPPAGGARAGPPAGPTPSRWPRLVAAGLGRRARGRAGEPRRGTPAAAPAAGDGTWSATPASCTRRSARRSALPGPHLRRGDRPRRC